MPVICRRHQGTGRETKEMRKMRGSWSLAWMYACEGRYQKAHYVYEQQLTEKQRRDLNNGKKVWV